jgi:hypothetical protein
MPKYTIIIETEDFELNNEQKNICEQIKFLIQEFKNRDKNLSDTQSTLCASLLIEKAIRSVVEGYLAKEIIELAKSKYPPKK